MFTFTFTALTKDHSKRVSRTTRCRTNDPNLAARKLYGARAFWWPDSGLPGYGQVMRSLAKDFGSTSVTDRVRLDVETK